ncbi:carcinoembryonic antigen-related cell adhesion molecule 1-like isoform X1 [Rhinatrema bivittatum]|uniref:carcinoembryonic antigen-related cell adhesion molecule 1-like isoform X1 n=1 Tax=Rhinatrema bivittatum TaxID=194408 RepID=UPI00112B626C|nr:carcinoembryonic antigen-related cell adhesion molecule 1-like isoform X1 [Rhinatrema bivittatum]
MGISRGLPAWILHLVTLGFLGFCSRQISAQISVVPIPKILAEGSSVLLSINFTGRIFTITWYRGETVGNNQILEYVPGDDPPEKVSPPYVGRVKGFLNGSMEISGLTTSDSGSYTVAIQTQSPPPPTATVNITVYAVLTSPTLEIQPVPAGEGTNVSLHCQAGSQTVDSYIFHKEAENISCDQSNIICSESNPFLYFHYIRKSDSGNYSCTIVNPISSSTSRAQELRVQVRISNVTLKINATSAYLWAGEDSVILTCTALGDEPRFSWSHNGTSLHPDPRYHLSASNETLTISPVTRSDAAAFSCTASNSLNEEKSQPWMPDISWRPDGRIQCGADHLGEQVMLRCSWPGGSPAANVQLVFQNISETQQNEVTRVVPQGNVTAGDLLTCHGNQINKEDSCSIVFGNPDGRIQCGADHLGEQVMLRCSWPGGSPAANVQLVFQNISETQQNEVTRVVPQGNVTAGDLLTCHGNQINKEDSCSSVFAAPQAPTLSNGSTTSIREGDKVVLEVILGSSSSGAAKASPALILPANFTWIYQTTLIIQPSEKFQISSGNYSSRLQISQVTLEDHGGYICEARSFMGKTNFYFIVNVTKEPVIPVPASQGLSVGAIVGIVIGVLAGVALIGLIVYLILRRKKKSNAANSVGLQAASHQPAETVYAQVDTTSSKQGVPVSVTEKKEEQEVIHYAKLNLPNKAHAQPDVQSRIPETTYVEIKT